MPETFLTFDEARAELGISPEQLRNLMDGKELACIVQNGVVKFRESDVLGLKSGKRAADASGRACGLHRQAPQDYGFVFLVDEDEEAAIEGNRYDGDLPTTMAVPDQAPEGDLVQPVGLSDDQKENLDIFSQLDLTAAARMGKEVAERREKPTELVAPEVETPLAPEPQPAPEVAKVAEPSAPEPEPEPELVVSEAAPPELANAPQESPYAAVPPEEPQDLEPPTLIVDQPEPVEIETPKEIITQLVEPKPTVLQFTVEPAPPTPKPPTKAEEKTDIYELAEPAPDKLVTEHIELATDEETQEIPAPEAQRMPEVDVTDESSSPPAEVSEVHDVEPLVGIGEVDSAPAHPQPQEEVPAEKGVDEASCVSAAPQTESALYDIESAEVESACAVEEPPAPVKAESVEKMSDVERRWAPTRDEAEEKPQPPAEVLSISAQTPVPTPKPIEAVEVTPPETERAAAKPEALPADKPAAKEGTAVPEPPQEPKKSAEDILDEIMKEVEEETGDKPVPKVEPPTRSKQRKSPVPDKEEKSVAKDEIRKGKGEKPEEDVFEVYDLEEETKEAQPAPPPPKAEEEEVVELEEVSDDKAAVERSVEKEMAELFGEGESQTVETVEPAVQAPQTDDFDLSIFKEGGETVSDVPALEEVDLSAMAEQPGQSGASTAQTPGLSRIDAITAPKGPSTAPWTALILLAFAAVAFGMMILMALASGSLPSLFGAK